MFSEDKLLAAAKASPAAVAAHDREAWLALFSSDAEVHDPVGSRGHAGHAALERFYATFIAPNQIRFIENRDIVQGQTVVRDLVIRTQMGNTGLSVDVPLFIRYEIVSEQGQPKVRRLYAHWELLPMLTGPVFQNGLGRGLSAMLSLTANMLRHQGIGGAMGFSGALLGVGGRAKTCAQSFLNALAKGDANAARACAHAQATLADGTGQALAVDALATQWRGLRFDKIIAGGRFVSARMDTPDLCGVLVLSFDRDQSRFRQGWLYSRRR